MGCGSGAQVWRDMASVVEVNAFVVVVDVVVMLVVVMVGVAAE